MANARIYGDFWTGTKRRKTELFLSKAGHKWPADPARGPMCVAECVARIWSFMDTLEDPSGDLSGVSNDDLEMEAGWAGKPGLLVKALTSCGWIDVSEDGASRRWHDYGAFNAKAFAVRQNGRGGGRPRRPDSVRSLRGDYDETDETNDETNNVTYTKPMTKQSVSGVPESEASRPQEGAPGCPRPPPPGSPSAAPRTAVLPGPSSVATPPGEPYDSVAASVADDDAPESPADDGSDMAEPAPMEAKPIETAAQTARRLAKIAFERELTRNLRLALPHIVTRWNETVDEIEELFPIEQHPKRADWIRYRTFPKSSKIRGALRARAREAIKAGRKFNDDLEHALLGVKSMPIWTSYSPGWRPNLESFFVASKWETKIAAGQQALENQSREEEIERRKDEAFDAEMDRVRREIEVRNKSMNGKVVS